MNSINNLNDNLRRCNLEFRGFSAIRRAPVAQRNYYADIVSSILSQDRAEIFKLTKNASVSKMGFLENLTERYNRHNYYRAVSERENSSLVNEIFKLVKFPKALHNNLVENFQGSLENLSRIFKGAANKTKRLIFAQKINNEILQKNSNFYSDLLPELLESPNSKEYVRNYPKYSSYLKLNSANKDIVKNLDEMLASGTYDRKKYDRLYNNEKLRSQFILPETKNFNSGDFVENYSKAGAQFLKHVSSRIFINKELMSSGADKILLNIYKTCNDKNIKLRNTALDVFAKIIVPEGEYEQQVEQLRELDKFFSKIDKDEHARKFIEYFVQKHAHNVISINSINKIFSEIPSSKLYIFKENAKRIIFRMHGEERLNALKNELENPFFETEESKESRKISEQYGFVKPRTKLHDFIKKVRNKVNILRYKKYKDMESLKDTRAIVTKEEKINEVASSDASQIDSNKQNNDNIKDLQEIANVVSSEDKKLDKTLKKNAEAKERVQSIETILQRPRDYRNLAESYVVSSPTRANHAENQFLYDDLFSKEISTPETREKVSEISEQLGLSVNYAGIIDDMIPIPLTEEQYSSRSKELEKVFSRKNLTKQDVYLYIQKKLGSKTLSTQKDAYKANATKMKLDMLPEIFASIAETRKADRAVGKYHINSSNKDALDLYLLINGNNKKYINYLLKKRNVDNTRMFEVKDIIAIIRKAEDRINKEKSNNPLFSSKDAKNYYNHLYESKIQQYGKVKRGVSNKA